jgi:UDP-2,3-diacylglucosamine hydrolase
VNVALPYSLFISDLHLCAERPAANDRLYRFLDTQARGAWGLYILGDLFESWVGDDELGDPLHARIAESLLSLAGQGVELFVMHGNRDFLLGDEFCRASGTRLLPEPSVVDLYGTPALLLHGDVLCTDDMDYQAFRESVRNPAWQKGFLALPLDQRRALARELRSRSERVKADKRPEIMDVNPEAVVQAFRSHDVTRMIHGHTHRPELHRYRIDGSRCERWVLPDWYETGGYLTCDAAGCRLNPL